MSLAEERARDIAEIIDDEPVTFKWLDAFYTGKKTATVPNALGMLDGGYEQESDIALLVLATQFLPGPGIPAIHDTIIIDGVSYKLMKVDAAPGYYTFQLKELL